MSANNRETSETDWDTSNSRNVINSRDNSSSRDTNNRMSEKAGTAAMK
jgi:hypothetical protein